MHSYILLLNLPLPNLLNPIKFFSKGFLNAGSVCSGIAFTWYLA